MMKNPPKLHTLPAELIHTISGHVELKDLLVLCRTSRQMHAICLRCIYRAIALTNATQLLKCCKTIISRPEAADSVRYLRIYYHPRYVYALKSFYTTFEYAIKRMKNLRVIHLLVRDLFRVFSRLSFPRLSDCTLPISSDIFPFLRRNPAITLLSMLPGADGTCPDFWKSPIQPIHMPKLEVFNGPDIVACSVVPGSIASHIGIFWPEKSVMEFSRDLAHVATSKADDIINLSCVICSWNPALLVAIAKYTPRIQYLQIRSMQSQGREDFLSALRNILPSLPCLSNLVIMDDAANDEIDEERELEFQAVQTWGEVSPALTRVTLSTPTPWLRLIANIWLPDFSKNCPETAQTIKWFIKRILNSPELPLEYSVVGNHLGGRDGMAALKEAMERDGVVPAFDILRKADGQTVISFLPHT